MTTKTNKQPDELGINDLQINCTIKEVSDSNNDFYIEGYANTITKDRSGDIILPSAFQMENYLKNPVILLQHNRDKPIGRMVDYKIDENGLKIKVYISSAAEDLYKVITLIKDGVLQAFSVGFRLLDGKYVPQDDTFVITSLELLETSIVSIPCNQDSVFEESKSFKQFKAKAIADAEKAVTTVTTTETTSTETETTVTVETVEVIDDEETGNPDDKSQVTATSKDNSVETEESQTATQNQGEKMPQSNEEKAIVTEPTPTTVDVEAAVQKALADREAKEKAEAKRLADEAAAKEAAEQARKEEIEAAVKAALEEKGLGMPNTDTRIEYLTTEMKESDRAEYMKDLDNLYLLAVSLGRPITGLKAFKKLPEEIQKAITDTGSVSLAPIGFDKRLEEDIRKELKIAKLFSSFDMPLADYRLPFNAAGVVASFEAAGATPSDQTVTFNNILFTAKKIMAAVAFNYEDEDDAVVALLPTIRKEIAYAMANLIDSTLITGDGTGNSFRGVSHYATGASFATTITGGASADFTPAAVAAARANLARYGINPREIALLINLTDYYKLVDDTTVQTVTSYGTGATLLTGELANIWGIPIIPTESIATPTTTGDVRAVLVRPDRFKIGYRKGVNVETWRDPRNQTKSLTGSLRLDFNPLVPLSSGQLAAANRFVENITVAA